MKPTMGGFANFSKNSPAVIVSKINREHTRKLCDFWILHGDLDTTVPISSSRKFYQSLRSVEGVKSILIEYL